MKRLLLAAALLTQCFCAHGRYTWVDSYPMPVEASGYALEPGDVISVKVLGHDELSTPRARIRTDGKVSLTGIQDVEVETKSPETVAALLTERLRPLLQNPVVTVTLEEMRPLNVSVMGEVGRPGVYPLEPGAGVLQALASAGGLNNFAHDDGIYVLRRVKPAEPPERIRFDYAALSRAEGKAATFRLRSSDVVVVE